MRTTTTAIALLVAAASSVLAAPYELIDTPRPIIVHDPEPEVYYVPHETFEKRQDGGNARSGSSGSVSGGDVINDAFGNGAITNDGSCEYLIIYTIEKHLLIAYRSERWHGRGYVLRRRDRRARIRIWQRR